MIERDFGISDKDLKLWLKGKEIDQLDGNEQQLAEELWYNRSPDKLLAMIHSKLKGEADIIYENVFLMKRLEDLSSFHHEVKMLFHNWVDDPAFFNKNDRWKQFFLKRQQRPMRKQPL